MFRWRKEILVIYSKIISRTNSIDIKMLIVENNNGEAKISPGKFWHITIRFINELEDFCTFL